MKAFLLFPDRDLDLHGPALPHEEDLIADLELGTLFDAMALGDRFVRDVVERVVLDGLTDPDTIRYRQRVLADCLERPTVVRDLYATITRSIDGAKKRRFGLFEGASADLVLSTSIHLLEFLVETLVWLRKTAEREAAGFASPAFSRLFEMLRAELDDAYFAEVADQLSYLRFRRGVPISAELGPGNKGVRHVLRRIDRDAGRGRWFRRGRVGASFEVDPRDDAGLQTLADIRTQGLNEVANALARSADHIVAFLTALRAELAFYLGCLNLHDRLREKGEPTCMPTPLPRGRPGPSARGLYDVCLTLHVEDRVVGSDVDAGDRTLVLITGANQGGKSTFLRSVGLAHLMMQCGMFVAADAFAADVRDGIFTHFKREEDASMESGKLDEELRRMSAIVDGIRPGSLLLCNESFSSTNEREGSEIARQIVRALRSSGVKILYVTHLFDLADGFLREDPEGTLFLRAERLPDGSRTFRVVPGAPLPTSHGRDLFERILGARPTPEERPIGTNA